MGSIGRVGSIGRGVHEGIRVGGRDWGVHEGVRVGGRDWGVHEGIRVEGRDWGVHEGVRVGGRDWGVHEVVRVGGCMRVGVHAHYIWTSVKERYRCNRVVATMVFSMSDTFRGFLYACCTMRLLCSDHNY